MSVLSLQLIIEGVFLLLLIQTVLLLIQAARCRRRTPAATAESSASTPPVPKEGNLYQQLDTAALRRFTFKLEFLPLTLEQRWAMFANEAKLKAVGLSEKRRSSYEERLIFMKDLTPGDFATVKRQCVLLGEELGPEEWLTQLELEAKAKARDTAADVEKER